MISQAVSYSCKTMRKIIV